MEGEHNSNMNKFDDELQLTRDKENDGDSSDNLNLGEGIQPKRKRYNRHSQQQIQHMESFFKECHLPDEQQRRELSRELGMEEMQVKFWFQNKRTQMKTQNEHKENTLLRSENEKLRAENMRYREVISNASCLTCAGPTPIRETTAFHEQQLQLENDRLRDEIGHISSLNSKFASMPLQNSTDTFASSSSRPAGNYNLPFGGGNFVINNVPQNQCSNLAILEFATAAMDELLRIAQLGDPLWVPSVDRYTTTLNVDEYFRSFSRVFGSKQSGVKSEASRESVIVNMNAHKVIEVLMDVEQWSNVFSGVVSRANILQVISPGACGTYNKAIQVMNAEFHVPTPLVQTRESYFLRYCRQDTDGTWAVVDVSLDQLLQYSNNPLVSSCRKRPSGCIVQDIPSGHSKVIWVEHVEVEERGTQSIYRPLIASGLAFGAKRWAAILEAHCERIATAFSTNMHPRDLNYIGVQEGRQSMLKLAERMVTMFFRGVNASIRNTWSPISGNPNESIKVMTRRNVDDATMPSGIQLIVATSFWLRVSPKIAFDFLRDHHNRNQWDVLSNGGEFQQVLKITSGNQVGNRICMYKIKGGTGSPGQGEVNCMLQESRSDPTGSYVVYAPIEKLSANVVLGGGDPNLVPLLPAGFSILPDGPIGNGSQGRGLSTQAESGGSLLTIAFQVLINSSTNPSLSVGSISSAGQIINSTVEKIKRALSKSASQGY